MFGLILVAVPIIWPRIIVIELEVKQDYGLIFSTRGLGMGAIRDGRSVDNPDTSDCLHLCGSSTRIYQ